MSKPVSDYTDDELDALAGLGPSMMAPPVYEAVQRRQRMQEQGVQTLGPAMLAGSPATWHLVTEEQWDALARQGVERPATLYAAAPAVKPKAVKPPKKAA